MQKPDPRNLPRRLLRLCGHIKCKEQSAKDKDGNFSLHVFLCCLHSTLDIRPFSLDHPIRPEQHRLRNRKIECFRGPQIDDELELRRLLNG